MTRVKRRLCARAAISMLIAAALGGLARAASAAPAAALRELRLRSTENGVLAVIVSDGALDHRAYVQEDPPRFVLDVLNVRNPIRDQKPTRPHPMIEMIRSEELPMLAYDAARRDETFGRLTFELKQPVRYRIDSSATELRVELIPKDGSVPPAGNGGASEHLAEANGNLSASSNGLVPEAVSIEPPDADPRLFFGPPPAHSDDYRLGPEDVVEVRVFELDQLNRTVRVSGDGSIELPLIGTVPVMGTTADEVGQRVADRLRNRYVQNPQVSVFVREFNARRVSLLGAVKSPAAYPLRGRRNLLQLLADAGGLSAAGNVLYVFRQMGEGRSARLTVPLDELLIQGDPRWNIWLLDGDVVSVPPEEAISISVLGAVNQPGIHKLPVGESATLLKAIARAGGLADRASKNGIQINRKEGDGKDVILKIDLGDVLSGKRPDLVLREGDVITVKERFF